MSIVFECNAKFYPIYVQIFDQLVQKLQSLGNNAVGIMSPALQHNEKNKTYETIAPALVLDLTPSIQKVIDDFALSSQCRIRYINYNNGLVIKLLTFFTELQGNNEFYIRVISREDLKQYQFSHYYVRKHLAIYSPLSLYHVTIQADIGDKLSKETLHMLKLYKEFGLNILHDDKPPLFKIGDKTHDLDYILTNTITDDITIATDSKATDSKATDSKAIDSKVIDSKAIDSKAIDSKVIDSKAIDSKVIDSKANKQEQSPLKRILLLGLKICNSEFITEELRIATKKRIVESITKPLLDLPVIEADEDLDKKADLIIEEIMSTNNQIKEYYDMLILLHKKEDIETYINTITLNKLTECIDKYY